VVYEPTKKRSLGIEVFMEKEQSLSLEVEKLGRPQDLAPAGEKNLQPLGGNGDL